MTNEKGFVFPFVLFIITIILITTTFNVSLYRHEIEIARNIIEQEEFESLFQMARASLLKEDIHALSLNSEKEYIFPNGKVAITISKIDDRFIHTVFVINSEYKSKHRKRYIIKKE